MHLLGEEGDAGGDLATPNQNGGRMQRKSRATRTRRTNEGDVEVKPEGECHWRHADGVVKLRRCQFRVWLSPLYLYNSTYSGVVF